MTDGRNQEILLSMINDTEYTKEPRSRNEELLLELKEVIEQSSCDVYTKEEIDNNFVAKKEGKDLSSNDYTDENKNKVEEHSALLIDNAAKNLLKWDLKDIKKMNTAGLWDGNTYIYGGVNITLQMDNVNLKSIVVTGTAEKTLYFNSSVNSFPDDSLTLNGISKNSGCTGYLFDDTLSQNVPNSYDTGSGVSLNLSASDNYHYVLMINPGAVNTTIYPMIRRSDITDATFEPYYRTQKQLDTDLEALTKRVEALENAQVGG